MTFAGRGATQKNGREPEGLGRSNVNMLKVAERPIEGKAKQESLDFLFEGIVALAPLEMHRILQVCQYEHQRPLSERHVDVLADLMRRDKWTPKGQIDFGVLDGHLYLVNGYHRGAAQVRTGKTITWSVVFHACKTKKDLHDLYLSFDTNLRLRGSREIMRATEFADEHGLPKEMADSLYRAIPFIASKFDMDPKKRNHLVEKQIDLRLGLAREYAKAAARFAACLEGMSSARKSRFKGGAITAVAVVTLRYQSAAAWEFWAGVANNDGLKRGDPRNALVMDLMTRKTSGGSHETYAPAIIAWNAFFNDRDLKLIKVLDSFVPAIDGTPFDGKR